jgi:hypothetical protein
MRYSVHALQHMQRRIISRGDVDAVIERPARVRLADAHCAMFEGSGPSGNRLRVLLDPMQQRVLTVRGVEEADDGADSPSDRSRGWSVLRTLFRCACRSDDRGAAFCHRCG